MKKSGKSRLGHISSYKLSVILVVLLFLTFSLPVEAAIRQSVELDFTKSEELNVEIEGEQVASSEMASIGTFWWYRDDPGLIYAEADATGFAETLEAEGCDWAIDRNSEYKDNPNNGNEYLDDSQLEDKERTFFTGQDYNYLETVDIAYFVGHSNKKMLGIKNIYLGCPLPSDKVEAEKTAWGDEGINKWVVLATCLAASDEFAENATQGTHLILGWKTICDDWVYGPVFANYIKEGYTLKEAWFKTGEDCQHVPAIARVIGENEEVGNDHLKGFGNYAIPSPIPDDTYVSWEHEVIGWQSNYNFIPPDYYVNGDWDDEPKAYDNHDPNYILGNPDNTYSSYDEHGLLGYTDWLTLKLNEPKSIRGFRISAGNKRFLLNGDYFMDKMEIRFLKNGIVKYENEFEKWEPGSWRIIDFKTDDFSADNYTVDTVQIRFHEDSIFNYNSGDEYAAKVYEFDFWEEDDAGNDDDSAEFNLETSLPNYETTMNVYSVVPNSYSQAQISNLANTLGLNEAVTYVDDEFNPATYSISGENAVSLKYHTESGVMRYSNPSETYPTVSSEPTIPSDKDALTDVGEFLRQNGLFSKDIVDATVLNSRQSKHSKSTGEIIYDWVTAKNVYLKKELDGLNLFDKSKITIGENGEIVSFDIPMRSYVKVGEYQIKAPEQAFSSLSLADSTERSSLSTDEVVNIDHVELCYKIDSLTESDGLLKPYYLFSGIGQDSSEPFEAFVSALDG